MDTELTRLIQTVQRNCDISDAAFAGDYTLCTYLLKMREYYRWTHGIPFGERIATPAVGAWVEGQEARWDELEEAELSALSWQGVDWEPFQADEINQHLLPLGYAYAAGLGRYAKPYFVVAECLSVESAEGYRLLILGHEHARELVAPPAMAQGSTIYIRRECLRRMLWERVEEWRWRKRENAMSRAIGCYRFDVDTDRALEHMTDNEMEAVILHEIGEVVAGGLVGAPWNDMLLQISRTTAEIAARSVRDLLADCLSALPAMLETENRASIHFYFANMTPLRADMFPSLERAYRVWVDSGQLQPLKRTVREGRQHWQNVAREVVNLYQRHGEDCAGPIESLVATSHL